MFVFLVLFSGSHFESFTGLEFVQATKAAGSEQFHHAAERRVIIEVRRKFFSIRKIAHKKALETSQT